MTHAATPPHGDTDAPGREYVAHFERVGTARVRFRAPGTLAAASLAERMTAADMDWEYGPPDMVQIRAAGPEDPPRAPPGQTPAPGAAPPAVQETPQP